MDYLIPWEQPVVLPGGGELLGCSAQAARNTSAG